MEHSLRQTGTGEAGLRPAVIYLPGQYGELPPSLEVRAEARRMLSEVYGWFTKGFDMKDLQEAKALIEALSQ